MPSGRPRKTPGGSSTTRRGYGGEHQSARARALRQLQDGEPCPFCSRPMYREQDLDFDHAVPLAEGGRGGPRRLSHASCNRSAGAKLGNRLRRAGRRPVAAPAARPGPGTLCYTCGRPMLAGQRLEAGPAAYGDNTAWSHDRCEVRDVSVPSDLV